MATLNPLEQKARSSFIKGFVIALLIGLLLTGGIGFLFFQKLSEENERLSKQKKVTILSTDVKSGQEIDGSVLRSGVNVDGDVVPTGAATDLSTLMGYFNTQDGEIDPTKIKLVAKTDLSAKTIITKDMVALSTEQPTDDLRLEQYNMIVLPVDLNTDETVDIRLRLPSGQDYIVISKKTVKLPEVAGVPSSDTIQMKVSEDEILTMSAAIVDAYKVKGSKLYAVKYAEPGLQEKVTPTYIPAADTLQLIASDPNIVQEAKANLINFYNANNERYRKGVADAIGTVDSETQKSNVESSTSLESSTQKSERQQYLQSME